MPKPSNDHSPPPAADAGVLPGETDLSAALLRAHANGADLVQLERVLLRFACQPEGLGFAHAHLLVWNTFHNEFEGVAWRGPLELPLREAIDPARPPVDAPEENERTTRLRRMRIGLDALDGVVRASWDSGTATSGAPDATMVPWADESHVTAIPLHRGNEPHGMIIAAWRDDAVTSAHALQRFIVLASASLGIAREAQCARTHTQRSSALAEMAQASVSAMNVAEALHLAARLAVRATGARGSAVWRCESGEPPRLEVTHGVAGQRERIARLLLPLAERAADGMTAVELEEGDGTKREHDELARQLSTVHVVPMVAYGHALGVVAVYDRAVFHPSETPTFGRGDRQFLGTLAHQTALVLDQAGRFDALRHSEQKREDLQRWVRREEHLATLGELATRAAREVRNPLASIGAFARRAHRELAEDDPGREYLEIIMREAGRLDRIVHEQVSFAEHAGSRMKMERLNAIVQNVLQASGEALVRRRIRLLKKLAPDLPDLLLDADRIRHVMANILDQAIDTVPVGGRVRVASRRTGDHVVLEVSHDGVRESGALLEELFAPFAASREGGPGVGLAVARQIIHEHGGEIRVKADAEWSTVLSFTLPVRENDDRRQAVSDRRRVRGDRRQRHSTI